MKLLKIGGTAINLDLVMEIEDRGDHIDVFFVAVNTEGLPLQQTFTDEQAELLRRWVTTNAEDVSDLDGQR